MSPILVNRLLKWIGYPLFGLVSFLVFLYITFPYDKLKDRIEQQLSASDEMSVSIESLGPSPLLGLSARGVLLMLTPRPKPPGLMMPGAPAEPAARPKPVRVVLDEVTVKAGLIGLLTGGTDVGFDVDGMGGVVSGEYEEAKKKGWSLSLQAEGLNLASISAVSDFVGLPVKGVLTTEIKLQVPLNRWSEASGSISLECEGCSVGDGKAKLKIPGNALLAMGITLPRIRLGRFGGQIKVEKGVATLENVSARSPDVEVVLEGTVNLRNPIGFSSSEAYLRFKISPELKKRDPKFELVEGGMGPGKRPDGFFGLRLVGPLRSLRPVPSAAGPLPGGGGGRMRQPPRQGFRRFPTP